MVPDNSQNLPKRLINPEDFGGLNPHEEFILDQFKVGGFIFDGKFISENLMTEGKIEQIRNLNLYKYGERINLNKQPLEKSEFIAHEQAEWHVSRDGDMIEKRAHPDRDTVGDIRIRYYSLAVLP